MDTADNPIRSWIRKPLFWAGVGLVFLIVVILQNLEATRPSTTSNACHIAINDRPDVSVEVFGGNASDVCAMLRRESRATHRPLPGAPVVCTTIVNGTTVTARSNDPLTAADRARLCDH